MIDDKKAVKLLVFQVAELTAEIARLRSELQEEREKHKWISVSERFPDNDEYVLVLNKSVYDPIVIAFFTSHFGGMLWIDSDNNYIRTHDVLAWQPLPEIPEES